MTPFQCECWFPDPATLSHLPQAIDFFEDISGAWRFNPVYRIIALIEAPVRTSIPFGRIASFGAAIAIVACSTCVTRFVRRPKSSHRSDPLGDSHSETEMDFFDENVEITVRIDDCGFDFLRKPRGVVTIHLSKKGPDCVKRALGKVAVSSEPRYKAQDHKVPFWVR